jgi:hypothetical protein
MYVWSSRIGFKPMVWRDNTDASNAKYGISDLENITYYNEYLFANSYNTFDVYFMKEVDANPINKTSWEGFWSFFSPTYSGHFSIDGVAHKGGSIMKIFTMSRSGLNDIHAYLVICTNMGEVILYQGAPVKDGDNYKWQSVGRFEIPVPLNKDSFAIMEGDIIVATRNGLVSLMRVVFGQSTNVTQSLETRIKNLFSDYMFRMNEFKTWIKLFYNFKNRLLILNVPTQMPIPLNEIERGYEFTHEQAIVLPSQYNYGEGNFKAHIAKFIREYLYTNYINYTIFIQFNESVSDDEKEGDGIYITFKTTVQTDNKSTITDVNFYIVCNGKKTNFFGNVYGKIQFTCTDFTKDDVIFNNKISFEWNKELKKTYSAEKKTMTYYGFSFPKFKDGGSDEGFTVTDIMTEVKLFAKDQITEDALSNHNPVESIKDYTILIARDDMSKYNGIADFPKHQGYNAFERTWVTNCGNTKLTDKDDVLNTKVDEHFQEKGSVPNDVRVMTKSVVENINHWLKDFHNTVAEINTNTITATIEYIIKCTNNDKGVTEHKYTLTYIIDYWSFESTAPGHTEYDIYVKVKLNISGTGIGDPKKTYTIYTTFVSFMGMLGTGKCPEIDFGFDIKTGTSVPWAFTDVQFNNDSLNFTDPDDTWEISNLTLDVKGPQAGVNFFCGTDSLKAFPWSSKTITTKEDLQTLNQRVGVYQFATFIFEKTPAPPPQPPPGPPLPDFAATINYYWNEFSAKDYGKVFRVSENFVIGALIGHGYNDTFGNLEKSYNELGQGSDVTPDKVKNPLEGKVSELFYNVTINFIKNSKDILATEKFKEKGSTGTWTYGYDVYDIAEGKHLLTSMQYEINYNYSGFTTTAKGDIIVVTYSIGLHYIHDNDPVNVLKGSITFFITKENNVDRIRYKGNDTVPAFKFTAVPFYDFDDVSLRDKHILIENAQWDLKATSEVDIRDILIKTGENEKPVFPFPLGTTIDELSDMDAINNYYGWMYSNFGIYGGDPPPPLPPEPPRTIQKSINECWEDESLSSCDSFQAEHKFKTGELKYRSISIIFEDLVELYEGAGTVTPDNIPNPDRIFGEKVNLSELFYNVAQNVNKNINMLIEYITNQGYTESVGTWTYGYDIWDGLTFQLAHMEYEVDYDYKVDYAPQSTVITGLECDYSIILKYTDHTHTTPEEQTYEFFQGTMTFSLANGGVNDITYSGFKNGGIDFDSGKFPPIDLKEKAVTIKNAQWKLEAMGGPDITGILTKTGDNETPVFLPVDPTTRIGTITDGKVAEEITKRYYGWMFSNFGFYGDNPPPPPPPPPLPPIVKTINECWKDDEHWLSYDFFEAGETFVTGELESSKYNELFEGLVALYDGKKVTADIIPHPNFEVAELFNKVAHHLNDNFNRIKDQLNGNTSSGDWTYSYDVSDGNTIFAMEYVVSYYYEVPSENKIKCNYSIVLNYTNKPMYTPISGWIEVDFSSSPHTIAFTGFEHERIDTFPFPRIEGKTITITNASWNLEDQPGEQQPSICEILQEGDHPVFPTGVTVAESETITNEEEAKKITDNFYGWMFSNFGFYKYQETKKEIKKETKPKSREVFKKRNKDIPVIPVSRDSLGDDPVPHVEAVKNTNFDLTLIPLLTGINILAPFRSSQYVMDSSYGTWSQWKDINMVDGIDHVNEFYFIIPQDFKPDAAEGGFIYNQSFLCKFNPEVNGDFYDMIHPDNAKPISVSYKTAATNFGNNNIKQISKIKLYGSASTFWGYKANNLKVTMHSDFFENPYQKYQHTHKGIGIREVLGLGADFDLRNLTYSQIKKYQRLYAEASSHIRNVEMGLICKPANRIALEVDMKIEEHNIIIYGYELYFKILNKL